MSSGPTRPPNSPPGGAPPTRSVTVERLVIVCVTLVVILLLALVLGGVYVSGLLRQQAAEIGQLRSQLADRQSPATPPDAPAPPTVTPPRPPATPTTRPAAMAATAATRLLNELLEPDARTVLRLVDADAAPAVFTRLEAGAATAEWDGALFERLAVAAALLDRTAAVERWSRRAAERTSDLRSLREVQTRLALTRGDGPTALTLARGLVETDPAEPRTAALLALAHVFRGDATSAAAALDRAGTPTELTPADMLWRARVLIALERWDEVAAVLAALDPLDDPRLRGELTLLQAARALHADDAPTAASLLSERLLEAPRDYDALVWYGLALERTGHPDEAAAAYTHAMKAAGDRPDAYYHAAVLALNTGDATTARELLNRTVQYAPAFAPAWAALAAAALNADDLPTALAALQRSTAAWPERPDAHFLLAVAHARSGARDGAAESLLAALARDPTLADRARETAAFQTLFRPQELAALLTPAATQPGPPEDGD